MKRTLISGVLTLALLTGTAAAAGPALLPEKIEGGTPSGITAAQDGSWLVTDTFNKVVWQVSAEGEVTRLAGQIGVKGLDGVPMGRYDDGTLDTAFFMEPWDIVPVLEGYAVSDAAAHVVRYIGEDSVQTLAGSGKSGRNNAIGIEAEFVRPTGLAVDEEGLLYIADAGSGEIRRMDLNGKVSTLAKDLEGPTGLCWHDGALYIAETGANRIQVLEKGNLSILVGGPAGDVDGQVDAARLNGPQDVAVAPDGAVYIADTGNGAIRKLADDRMTTVLELGELNFAPVMPRGLLLQEDRLLVTDPFATTVLELELEQSGFPDVAEEQWFYDGVMAAHELGLVNGMEDGSFAPDGPVTRAQFVTMLANLQMLLDGGVVIDGKEVFEDVPADLWCAKAVNWAAESDIAGGTGEGSFSPNQPLTRQQMVTFLWRFAQHVYAPATYHGGLEDFSDADQVAQYARFSMAWAVDKGLIQGAEGMLLPEAGATRAQGAQVLVRFLDWLQSEENS